MKMNSLEFTSSLWQTLWLNVRHREAFLASGGDAAKTALHFTFPWCASIMEIQKKDGETHPVQVHPAHVFWAMPRRIRLDLETVSSGVCDLCGRVSDLLIERYVARPKGLNYKGPWFHPLSPYYEGTEGMLPLHPQPDGLGYKHWLAWTLGMQSDKRKVERATAIDHFLLHSVEQRAGIGLRLWAFGYDMDNMKARCWYESTMPLYALADCNTSTQRDLRDDVGTWLDGADLVASYLRGAVKDAWFSGDARGEFAFVTAAFWSRTEAGFYALLGARIQAATDDSHSVDRHAASEGWMAHLGRAALHLFDGEWVGTGQIERTNPARVAAAHNQLSANLQGAKLRMALHLPARDKRPKGTQKIEPDANKAE